MLHGNQRTLSCYFFSTLFILFYAVGTYSAFKGEGVKDALGTVCAAIAVAMRAEVFLVLQLRFPRHSSEPLFGVLFHLSIL